jgi:hypothetical protein
MRWRRGSAAAGRPDLASTPPAPASAPPDPASIAYTRRITEGRRELRGRASAGVVHDVEVEERRRREARSGHHATGSGHPTRSDLHGLRPPDPRGEERAEGEGRWIRLRERGREEGRWCASVVGGRRGATMVGEGEGPRCVCRVRERGRRGALRVKEREVAKWLRRLSGMKP